MTIQQFSLYILQLRYVYMSKIQVNYCAQTLQHVCGSTHFACMIRSTLNHTTPSPHFILNYVNYFISLLVPFVSFLHLCGPSNGVPLMSQPVAQHVYQLKGTGSLSTWTALSRKNSSAVAQCDDANPVPPQLPGRLQLALHNL
jgi:hypothetical protein